MVVKRNNNFHFTNQDGGFHSNIKSNSCFNAVKYPSRTWAGNLSYFPEASSSDDKAAVVKELDVLLTGCVGGWVGNVHTHS